MRRDADGIASDPIASNSTSPSSPNGATRRPARCRAASSRCSPSARVDVAPKLVLSTSLRWSYLNPPNAPSRSSRACAEGVTVVMAGERSPRSALDRLTMEQGCATLFGTGASCSTTPRQDRYLGAVLRAERTVRAAAMMCLSISRPTGQPSASGTGFIRYVIDPFQREAFAESRATGGASSPSAAAGSSAISFPTRAPTTSPGGSSPSTAWPPTKPTEHGSRPTPRAPQLPLQQGFILSEERTFLEAV
jgi:hypothetical protein